MRWRLSAPDGAAVVHWIAIAVGFVLFLVGIGIGEAGKGSTKTETQTVAGPTTTRDLTVTVNRVRTVIKRIKPPRSAALSFRGNGGPAAALAGSTALILPTHTPGARYSTVKQATISSTVCKSGWTKTIRPPASYTNALKKAQLLQWRYKDRNPSHYEEDHLISLELGGAPRSHRNLRPEPWSQAHKSHPRENAWHKKVCNGSLTLRQAQKAELAYKRKYG